MMRILIAGVSAVVLLGILGTTGVRYAAVHDSTPECCQKQEGCCPGSSCCKSGSHTHSAHCPMMHA